MAVFLPCNDIARLPLDDDPGLADWHARLLTLPAWAAPFDGLSAPQRPLIRA
jgi:glutathione S-transferase